jgi:hypothetical protein
LGYCDLVQDLRDVLELERLHDDIQLVNRQNPVYVDSAKRRRGDHQWQDSVARFLVVAMCCSCGVATTHPCRSAMSGQLELVLRSRVALKGPCKKLSEAFSTISQCDGPGPRFPDLGFLGGNVDLFFSCPVALI